jgi:photosystem II stability/assembly factor-like uncharacterized protein
MAYDLAALSEPFERDTAGAGPPAPRASTHKLRSGWFQAREAWPFREAPVRLLTRERTRAAGEMAPAGTPHEWSFLGPANVGGRMTCAVHHPTDGERLWAGAAGGGVWHSPDGGRTWSAQWHDEPTLNVGSLAVDPADPDVIYCGTGEANLSTDSHPGVGLMRTLDAGASWHLLASAEAAGLPARIGALAVDPFDPRFRADDPAGQNWTKVSPPENQFKMWMVFLSLDSRHRGTLFTGSQRVWRTDDDGDTWTPVSAPLDGSDITAIEVSRADRERVYVGTENGGFFRSVDRGETWSGNLASTVLPGFLITRVQSRADDAEIVYATVANFGNRHVFRSTDGGLTWTDIDRGNLPDAPVHSIALPASRPGRVYVCGDAGVFVSDDEGVNWSNLTANLPNVMVVDLVHHEQDRTLTAATYGRGIWRLRID